MRAWAAVVLAVAASLTGASALAACQLGQLAQIPVNMVGLRPTITVQINAYPAVFAVDSGAFFSMISPAAAAQFHLQYGPAPEQVMVGGIGGVVSDPVANVRQFGFGPFHLTHVDLIVGGNELGGGAQGLLGQNLLRVADVEYDLANGVMRLMRPMGCGDADLAYWDRDSQKPVSMIQLEASSALRPWAVATAYLNGSRIRAMFDTGSPLSLLSLRAAQRAGVRPGGADVTPGGYSFGIGRAVVPTWIAHFDSFKLGDEEIRNTHLRIAGDDLGDIDMLIGADFFLAHRIYVANSQRRLYFTYNGGPVFNLTAYLPRSLQPASPAPGAAAAATPSPAGTGTAVGFARRGAALAARGEFVQAIAELTRAIELDPTQFGYYEQRGAAELGLGQPQQALADFDHSLRLKPDEVAARMARARLRIAARNRDGALADLQVIDQVLPKQADMRLALGNAFLSVEEYSAAIAQYTLWLASHHPDVAEADALNARCWARALTGTDLPQALRDCTAAVRASPAVPVRAAALDSRGLVRLRLGDYRRSIRDYSAALKIRPQQAWSLYGRGIDELRLGRAAAGDADMQRAAGLAPQIAADFRHIGISP